MPNEPVGHEARPWGNFTTYAENQPCTVKIITVKAGEKLSLQSHKMRSEMWVSLDEAMDVEIDGEHKTLKQGEIATIPVGTKHRAIGLDQDCRWLEVSFGEFDENDIVRYEDEYGRA